MGTGKSTVGRLLAERLDREFVDTDQLIESRHGSIPTIFATVGEAAFRAIERELAVELAARDNLIIATGGRLLLDPANEEALDDTGLIYCLTATEEEILERVQGGPGLATRPMLAGGNPRQRILELLGERAEAYAAFEQVSTSGRTPALVAEDLAGLATQPLRQ
ncbi:UNVERIFIED_CONTAM: hypothetical protein GTU68_046371 [Idotea baltica]|nr:hypothetical protein [Idotea baltica]